MPAFIQAIGFHDMLKSSTVGKVSLTHWDTRFEYTFRNFFHPFVGELISKLNRASLPGMLDPAVQETREDFFQALYNPAQSNLVGVNFFPKEIDVEEHGPYANYNWELFFHIPLTVAVHLSKTKRFAEAQRWFHYIFDPTSNDQSVDPPQRFWKFVAFRRGKDPKQIDELLTLLSKPVSELLPGEAELRDEVLNGYQAILNKPFQPHAVARTRHLAYQYSVVMKYLDNLIAWGDDLFQQDTVESINEATQRYVLAQNLLGPRPQRIPPMGEARPKTFAQLKAQDSDPMGNALVELEGRFPFNLAPPPGGGDTDSAGPLFGIGRTLYFCIPRNEKLLGYWDTVADRLFKIRHCMNIEGVVRPLALFDPPIDPGMLVKAAAAGINIGSIVSGLNQPVGPVRCLTLIQKALELCGEVRGLGGALLAAVEKGDGEALALTRQRHEIQIQQMAQEVRFLQWKSAEEATRSLLTSRATALERLHYYQRLLGLPAEQNAPDSLALDRRELTEENFDDAYDALVGQYDKTLTLQRLPATRLAGNSSPAQQSGAAGSGPLYLNTNEHADLNQHSPAAADFQAAAWGAKQIAPVLGMIPQFPINLHYWGIGGTIEFGGEQLSKAASIGADILELLASRETYAAGSASKTASFERRAADFLLQYNLAAHELMQNGRQILASLIAEQVAHHEYLSTAQQIKNSQEVDQFLHDKFTSEELYLWMQGEVSRLYYEYYRFAFDTARKAERTMKQELMRPEVDAQDFVKFNYWDVGRKGLLSGEALHLDLKRLEMAYHENNKREFELTRHVSLRQLDPLALLTLKATGKCEVTIPEWLYDRDCPGHYLRRIKSVALSLPSVVGPYTSVNCTLSLLRSSVRKSPLMKDSEYARQGSEDDRFVDYVGAVQSVVTSMAANDSGMFETNLRDERFLPFEGAGAESTWKIALPDDYHAFDYATISDVILHVRYTARQGVDQAKVKSALADLLQQASQANLSLLFSLRHDFPGEWSAFVNGAGDFSVRLSKDYFPYMAQDKTLTIDALKLYAQEGAALSVPTAVPVPDDMDDHLNGDGRVSDLSIPPDAVLKREADARVFLIVRYSLSPLTPA
ncbi:MAG TPA: hypothetical protein VGC87_11770 [Pyrinomonadaceae bacterium]|jgi:hypothetical protein